MCSGKAGIIMQNSVICQLSELISVNISNVYRLCPLPEERFSYKEFQTIPVVNTFTMGC